LPGAFPNQSSLKDGDASSPLLLSFQSLCHQEC